MNDRSVQQVNLRIYVVFLIFTHMYPNWRKLITDE